MALLEVTPSRPHQTPHSTRVKFSDSRTIQAITVCANLFYFPFSSHLYIAFHQTYREYRMGNREPIPASQVFEKADRILE